MVTHGEAAEERASIKQILRWGAGGVDRESYRATRARTVHELDFTHVQGMVASGQ